MTAIFSVISQFVVWYATSEEKKNAFYISFTYNSLGTGLTRHIYCWYPVHLINFHWLFWRWIHSFSHLHLWLSTISIIISHYILQTVVYISTGRPHFMQFCFISTLKNLHHFLNLCSNFGFNVLWQWWSLATCLMLEGSREWYPCHMWGLNVLVIKSCGWCGSTCNGMVISYPKWVRYVNQHHLVQSNWKTGKRQSVLKRN